MDRWLGELGLASRRRVTVLDLGCGFGALGLAMAVRAPGIRVRGLDLDRGLIEVGRQLIEEVALADRVTLEVADIDDADTWTPAGLDAVVAQAVVVHTPRPRQWLAVLLARWSPGTAIGLVEPDRVAAAEGVLDSVADSIEGHAGRRVEVARAMARGARELFGIDRRVGNNLAPLLQQAGADGVRVTPLTGGMALVPPYDPDEEFARLTHARLRRRIADADDDLDRQLALAGGLSEQDYSRWVHDRRCADRRRLELIERGLLARDDRAGWFAVTAHVGG